MRNSGDITVSCLDQKNRFHYFLLFVPPKKYAVRVNVYLLTVGLLADDFAYIIIMLQQYQIPRDLESPGSSRGRNAPSDQVEGRLHPQEVALSSASRGNSTCKLQCTLFLKLGAHYYREPLTIVGGAPLMRIFIQILSQIRPACGKFKILPGDILRKPSLFQKRRPKDKYPHRSGSAVPAVCRPNIKNITPNRTMPCVQICRLGT